MVASDGFAEFLREQLSPLGRLTMRRMFGKTGVFCDGLMCGMITEDTLYVRVDDHNKAVFKEAAPSTCPFGASRSGCSMSPMSLSCGRVPRWAQQGGSLPKENGHRYG